MKLLFLFKSYIPKMTQVSDLLPSIGFAGHLSQMQEKMCVLNLSSLYNRIHDQKSKTG